VTHPRHNLPVRGAGHALIIRPREADPAHLAPP
jgi:hypothetical protein